MGYPMVMTALHRAASARPTPADAAPAPAGPTPGTFTGVAGGNLGTAANLEDTQVYRLEDLEAPEAPVEYLAEPEPEPVMAVTAPAAQPVPTSSARPVAVSERLQPLPRAQSRSVPGGTIAAAVLVAVIGGAALLALANAEPSDGSGLGAGAGAPTVGATLAPPTEQPNEGGAGGGNGGNGGGNGRANGGGNGGGNGRGNGN
jgi:hypothetical protein